MQAIIEHINKATKTILKAIRDGQAVTNDNIHDINEQLTDIRGELLAIRESMSK